MDAVNVGNLHQGIIDARQSIIRELPSAEPERKKGTWTGNGFEPLHCSECGKMTNGQDRVPWADKFFNFCPNCGADMRGEQDG